jgi:hypothetical protein
LGGRVLGINGGPGRNNNQEVYPGTGSGRSSPRSVGYVEG